MSKELAKQFQIQSIVELDFVIGQGLGYPVGMQSNAPSEFKRRILAAKLSYELQLKSIDYALKRYVHADEYGAQQACVGDDVSNYLRSALSVIHEELKELQSQGELPFGVFGAELTLFRLPHALDTARMLSNRGLLLEVFPLLRLSLEMIAWAHSAFFVSEDKAVVELKAQSCISSLKKIYGSAGQLYGFLSEFAHWGHAIHGKFIDIYEGKVGIVNASVRYRAISLSLCLAILDVYVEVIKAIYREKSDRLISRAQLVSCPERSRNTYQFLVKIADASELGEVRKILSFLPQ